MKCDIITVKWSSYYVCDIYNSKSIIVKGRALSLNKLFL